MSGTWINIETGHPANVQAATEGDDSYRGYDGQTPTDNVDGRAGNDSLEGNAGNDLVFGGPGADELRGGDGDDRLNGDGGEAEGAPGDDLLIGGAGMDDLRGMDGDDRLFGGTDDDWFAGGPGNDTIIGGTGIDTLILEGEPGSYSWTTATVDGVAGWLVADQDSSEYGDGSDFVADVEFALYRNFGFAEPTIEAIDVPCFLAGTLIATPAGERAIETLRIGDLVVTADGRAVPILFTGRTTVEARSARGARGLPILVRAGALAEGIPHRDLRCSPHHGIVVEGMLVFAQALVNGMSIRRVPAPAPVFVYHNIETEAHEVILANGAPVETFCDNIGREAFDNHADFAALYPQGRDIGEMALPHAKSARQVPRGTRARLEARALRAAGDVPSAA